MPKLKLIILGIQNILYFRKSFLTLSQQIKNEFDSSYTQQLHHASHAYVHVQVIALFFIQIF